MNEEIKAEWVRRLRSGDIPQTASYLGRVDGFRCCLGVLSDMAVEAGIATRTPDADALLQVYRSGGHTETSLLLHEILDWAGLHGDEDGDIELDGVVVIGEGDEALTFNTPSLSFLNDNGATFAQIADVIEEYL